MDRRIESQGKHARIGNRRGPLWVLPRALLVVLLSAFLVGCWGSDDDDGRIVAEETAEERRARLTQEFLQQAAQNPEREVIPPEVMSSITKLQDLADGDDTAIPAILEIARGGDHVAVKMEAISSLEDIRTDAAAKAMGDLFATSTDKQVKLRVIEGLDYIEGPVATDLLLDILNDPDADVREEAADVVSFLVGADDEPRVQAAFDKEADRQVKEALQEALQNIEVEKQRAGAGSEEQAGA